MEQELVEPSEVFRSISPEMRPESGRPELLALASGHTEPAGVGQCVGVTVSWTPLSWRLTLARPDHALHGKLL